jgi:flagellar capping protein FliD
MGISVNGPSGIDTAYIIESLIELEQQSKITPVEKQKDAYQLKIDAYAKLKSYLADIGSKAAALKNISSFDLFQVQASNESIVTAEAGTGAVAGQFDLTVFQLARNEKMITANNLITSQSDTLDTFGIGSGVISVGGVEITIDAATDTIQDLRVKINAAKDATGAAIGVSASVIKMSDTNFRLVLTAKESGAAGVEYADVSGTVLQQLGVLDAAGEKGTTSQQLRSADDIGAAFAALAVNSIVQWSGTDHNGNAVAATFVKTASSTIDDFLAAVGDSFHGMVAAEIDGTGNLTVTGSVAGSSQLAVSSLTMGGTGYAMDIRWRATRGREYSPRVSTPISMSTASP